eukprot:8864840-Pyramimonas_sp.AAC.1
MGAIRVAMRAYGDGKLCTRIRILADGRAIRAAKHARRAAGMSLHCASTARAVAARTMREAPKVDNAGMRRTSRASLPARLRATDDVHEFVD